MKPTLAISIGDLNGIGLEIALKSHQKISQLCTPLYCINEKMLEKGCNLLNVTPPPNIQLFPTQGEFDIYAGKVCKESGLYSYHSFVDAIHLCEKNKADALVTLPIHKEAWMMAGLHFKGHTDLLRKHFQKEAIMMLGCQEMFVALYTEHIPLHEVAKQISTPKLTQFLLDLYNATKANKVAVLGLNPHAGDNGVLGSEERMINKAIEQANSTLNKKVFQGPIVPDIAFTPTFRKNFNYFVAMYHDQGLAPLKALYFDESINLSLNLPIIRTSVDHGTAFDIAYTNQANTLSYLNAIKTAVALIHKKL